MGIIKDKKKFERSKEQDNPIDTNIDIDIDKQNNTFDIDEKTIKKQQNKKQSISDFFNQKKFH